MFLICPLMRTRRAFRQFRPHSWYERALASPQAPYWHGTLLLNVCVTFDLDSGTSGEAIDTNCHPNQ